MATSTGSVTFAIDGSSLSPVHDAVSASGHATTFEVLLVTFTIAAVLVGVVGVLSYLRGAETRLERELTEVADEREAFLAFADAIDDLQVGQGSAAMVTPHSVQTLEERGPPIEAVQSAFEETVMGVEHYDEAYGESWIEHLGAELDPGLAATLSDRSVVNMPIKQALKQRSLDAAAKRDDLLHVLTTEESAIDEATTELESIHEQLEAANARPLGARTFDELVAAYETVDDLQARTDRLSKRRQRQIHRASRHTSWDSTEMTLQEYLYGSLQATYPVLAASQHLDERFREAKRRLLRTLVATV